MPPRIPSELEPRWPRARMIERRASSARAALGLLPLQRCDPRQLLVGVSIAQLVETQGEWMRFFALDNPTEAQCLLEGRGAWSGALVPIADAHEYDGRNEALLVHPVHSLLRRTFTIAHHLGHRALGHRQQAHRMRASTDATDTAAPWRAVLASEDAEETGNADVTIPLWPCQTMRLSPFRLIDEAPATEYGLALLIPYAPLCQLTEAGDQDDAIAARYGVSVAVLHLRRRLTGLL